MIKLYFTVKIIRIQLRCCHYPFVSETRISYFQLQCPNSNVWSLLAFLGPLLMSPNLAPWIRGLCTGWASAWYRLRFCGWMVVMAVPQWGDTQCLWTVRLKMVKMVPCMDDHHTLPHSARTARPCQPSLQRGRSCQKPRWLPHLALTVFCFVMNLGVSLSPQLELLSVGTRTIRS